MTAQRPDENESDGYTMVKQGHLGIGSQIYKKHSQNKIKTLATSMLATDVGDELCW